MFIWGRIDKITAYADTLSLTPGVYRLTTQTYDKEPSDKINILSQYAYVSYDSNQKITKIIFLPTNGTWQNQKELCQAYINVKYIEHSYHFCSADLYKNKIITKTLVNGKWVTKSVISLEK